MFACQGQGPVSFSPDAGCHPLRGGVAAALRAALLVSVPLMLWTYDAQAPVHAQSQWEDPQASASFELDLPAGTLAEALNRLASATNAYLAVDGSLTAGLQAPALAGRMTVRQALDTLLANSGLVAREVSGRYFIESAPQVRGNGAVASLEAVEIIGAAVNPKDEVYRAPQSISVLTRDDIERFRGTSVGDIFQGTPGVLVGENRNSGGLDVNIRGMQGQGRVPVLVDGARQETTVYRGYAGVSSRSYVDPDLIGGITVEKGPSLSAQGTGAVGGMVSMRTIDVGDILKDGENFGIRLRGNLIGNNSGSPSEPGQRAGLLGGGMFRKDCISAELCGGVYDPRNAMGPEETMDRPGTFTPKSWAGSLALGGRLGRADLLAAVATRRQGNYYAGRHGPVPYLYVVQETDRLLWTDVEVKSEGASRVRGGERVINSNYESRSSLLKGRFYLSEDQQLDVSWLRYDSEYGELMPSQLIWYGSIEQTNNSHVTVNTFASKYRWQPMDRDWLDLQANLWLTRSKTLNNNYSEAMKIIGEETERYRRWGGDISNTMQLNSAHTAELRYGAALQKESVDSVPEDELYANTIYGRMGERSEYSVFAALKYQFLPSLTLDAGWRYTRFHSNDNKPAVVAPGSKYCVISAGQEKCDPLFMSARGSGSAPLVALTWEPLSGVQLYGRYATALRMPSLFETTTGFSVNASPDAVLKPERARTKEIGLNLIRDGLLGTEDSLRLKFAYFRNHTKDYLTRTIPNKSEDNSVGTSGGIIGNGNFRMRNIESARFEGFELSGVYDAGLAWLEFGGTRYTRIETCHRGTFRRDPCTNYGISNSYINNMIPPKWHASMTLGTRWLDRRLTLGVRGTFMGRRTQVPDVDNQSVDNIFAGPVQWHAYRVFDLFASYRVNDSVSIDFNLDNMTDRYYLDALSLGLVPAPGRTARLGATLQF